MRHKLSRLLLGFSVLVFGLVIQTAPALAFNIFDPACKGHGSGSSVCAGSRNIPAKNPIAATLINVAGIISLVIGVAAVIMIMLGGLRFILSGGDPNSVKTARNQIIFAAVGIVVALLAQAIIAFALNNI